MAVRTYSFKFVVEPDADRWHASCPVLQAYGAATWGNTREEAFRHINKVVQIIIDELREDGIAIPDGPREKRFMGRPVLPASPNRPLTFRARPSEEGDNCVVCIFGAWRRSFWARGLLAA
jgi:predicted RNase H-like HicB family nuclease